MNTPTITMPTHVARDQLRQYRKQLHRRADSEYAAVAQGLEQLAKGTPLLNLDDCFKNVPLDEHYRPRLAIARSDRERVWFRRIAFDRGEFSGTERNAGGRPWPGMRFTFTIPTVPAGVEWYSWRGHAALVPMIPAAVRENVGRFDPKQHFILWEADYLEPPRDPYLLRHCGGSLYAILAEWDLTELERAVMAGRPRA